MTRKALNAFNPSTLQIGQSKHFEVRNPLTGYKQVHYFYRHADGELFTAVCQNSNAARRERDEWVKAKAKGNRLVMKYQCNSCGKVHDTRQDAVNCHPDINEIPEEEVESRLAAQKSKRRGSYCDATSVELEGPAFNPYRGVPK